MKNVIYECGMPNTLSGGFGDRLMGIASCLSLCDKTNSNLLIKWDDFKLNEFFDYEKYDYYKECNIIKNNIGHNYQLPSKL